MVGKRPCWLVLLAGVWLALLSGAAALGYGHRDTADCPHCELLALERRRHIDRGVSSRQSRILAERPEVVAPTVSIVAALPSAVTVDIPAPIFEEAGVVRPPSVPFRTRALECSAARAPPSLA